MVTARRMMMSRSDPSALYAGVVLADSPLGFWLLDETSGSTADDKTAHSNDMTLVNTPTLGATGPSSVLDTAMTFAAGSLERAVTGNRSLFNVAASASWSFEMWLKYTTVGTTTQVPAAWRLESTSVPGVTCVITVNQGTSGRIAALTPNSAGSGYVTIGHNGSWNDGNWHHVVARAASGGDFELVIDNVERASSASARNTGTAGDRVINVGSNVETTPLQWWSGSACAVAAYDQYLDDTEVNTHYDTAI